MLRKRGNLFPINYSHVKILGFSLLQGFQWVLLAVGHSIDYFFREMNLMQLELGFIVSLLDKSNRNCEVNFPYERVKEVSRNYENPWKTLYCLFFKVEAPFLCNKIVHIHSFPI